MGNIHQYISETQATGLPNARNATESDFNRAPGLSEAAASLSASTDIVARRQTADDVANVQSWGAKAAADWAVRFKTESESSALGDPTFADKFNASFQDFVNQSAGLPQTAEGSRSFQNLSAHLAGTLSQKAGEYQIASASARATQDYTTDLNHLGAAIITDPNLYGTNVAQAVSALHDPASRYSALPENKKGELEIAMRDHLAKSYIQGLINQEPAAGQPAGIGAATARDLLMKGTLDSQLNPKDKELLIRLADQGVTAGRVKEEHEAAMAIKAQKEAYAQANDALMGKFITHKLHVEDVRAAGLPAFGEGSQATWYAMITRQTRDDVDRPVRSGGPTVLELFRRINLPAGKSDKLVSLDEINKNYSSGLISVGDRTMLEKSFNDQKTDAGQRLSVIKEEFFKAITPQLDRSTINFMDVGGKERVYNFRVFAENKLAKALQSGVDPYTLLNPNNPEYLGKSAGQFKTGAQNLQQGMAAKLNTSLGKAADRQAEALDKLEKAAQRKPGESIAAYLARKNAK